MTQKNDPTKPSQTMVYVDAQVGLEEVAAIKVAEVERALLIEQEQLRVDIKKAESETPAMGCALQDAVLKDTKENYPEFFEIEKALKGLCKSFELSVVLGSDSKVQIQVNAHGSIAWKGDKSKALLKELEAHKAGLEKMIDRLANTKKKLGMLPHLERTAKAAVAKARLIKTEEGREILAQIDKISLPALPGPK
jgi:hypothetical protein